ncbi:MAG TPA: 23S rRNA (guanosine(2251)-2'-O)-methyltransferase RlmB [Flavobacteriaceae bacterium]|nr:23S rRNA (guanosine(2251)-2'-O)-methyltransferase RlmB [Flavobacteriaceae bacterium]MAY53862.1 23S rRNA (guanosine(2251)-2'-O)-methyltransferase RlmB [Flavobacteriaceae bacterium]HIB49586.1 23S rRNA (guanosine(2251)-2'-O)-methyltransferase RlmB [Flavobacteriaceae bacterium]HIN98148.1 23S rRNA (guanosine(2251)-2'-O)-methyltransferase RlmB [Flavobacteriaceae bacterium]
MNKEHKIFGIYPVLEALKSDTVLDKIYVQKDIQNPKVQAIIDKAQNAGATVNEVPIEKLNRLTKGNHQGVVAITSPISFPTLEDTVEGVLSTKEMPLFLVLDQISDVRNFGAILRTAECTGVDAVIIQKKGGAPVSGDTVKTSAGAIFSIPICKVDHIKDAIFYLQGSGITTIAATEKSDQSLFALDFKKPMALILGSEGKGVSKSVLSLTDESASLPLLGTINSLNVSVACGAFLYEAVRQRSL